MTRPNIVRADTIDLQDQDNPSAADHNKPATENGLAPHQRAEVDHVLQERHSEEEALAEAWNIAGSLTDEPDAIHRAQQDHESSSQQNGDESGNSETDGDDDMMDRISSSPSIDDGVYTIPSSPPETATPPVRAQQPRTMWPKRTSSLSPSPRDTPTPTQHRETFNQSPLSSTSASSPFLQTPQHLPLQARRTVGLAPTLQRERPSDCLSSSPFDDSPEYLPMIRVELPQDSFSLPSRCHHGMGRYTLDLVPEEDEEQAELEQDEGYQDKYRYGRKGSDNDAFATATREDDAVPPDEESDRSVIVHRPSRPAPDRLSVSSMNTVVARQLEHSPSFSSIQSFDISDILLPVDDPLLDKPLPPSPTDSASGADSWETASDHGTINGHDQDGNDDDDDDDTDALFLDLDDRFIDSGWGGECLRDTEDIDFEFVYALHTFVATVEGQANATKGDTMVLLDDSNSYWWLVRVVKDSSIGYLPAEHIETPTERLARLNKHRNIDLSATMLSDNAEKSRNPLKKAIKRRNAKTVQFAAPTYVEASDNDYSSEEEENGVNDPYAGIVEPEKAQQDAQEADGEARASSEARTSHENDHRLSTSSRDSFDREQAATLLHANDEPQLSPKLIDKTEAAPLKSRKGTPRNTDSFLKDDSIETKKITITPGLLREDGSAKSASSESARNTSLENLTKMTSPEQVSKKESKKEKEKKEKKPGMLSGLFKSKKKDKERKTKEDVVPEGDAEKPSNEFSRESPRASPAPSGRSSPSQQSSASTQVTPGLTLDTRRPEVQARQSAQKGKLTKSPVSAVSPSRGLATDVDKLAAQQPSPLAPADAKAEPIQQTASSRLSEDHSPEIAELAGSEAAHEMSAAGNDDDDDDTPTQIAHAPPPPAQTKEGPLSPLTNMLRGTVGGGGSGGGDKPTKAKRSKQRVELDDFDSPVDGPAGEEEAADGGSPNPFMEQEERTARKSQEGERDAFMHGTDSIHIPTMMPADGGDGDDGVGEEGASSSDGDGGESDREGETPMVTAMEEKGDLMSARGSTPSLVEQQSSASSEESGGEEARAVNTAAGFENTATPTGPPHALATQPMRGLSIDSSPASPNHTSNNSNNKPSPLSPSPATEEQPWSDTALRTWLDTSGGAEVRDMLLLIRDTSGVKALGLQHPLMEGLGLEEERRGVGRMMGELDGLLVGWLRGRGVVVT